jgi:hypothetical protein
LALWFRGGLGALWRLFGIALGAVSFERAFWALGACEAAVGEEFVELSDGFGFGFLRHGFIVNGSVASPRD